MTGPVLSDAFPLPIGLAPGSLPVGVQIAGLQYGDRTCIAFARSLEEECQAFAPPLSYE